MRRRAVAPAVERKMLNHEQNQAVEHEYGPCFVCACPGSGKTRTIIERTIRLIEKGHSPRSILCISFTNKAAKEMKERLCKRLGEQGKEIYICTFHALAATIIRKYGAYLGYDIKTTILDDEDQQGLMQQCARQLNHELTKQQINSILWQLNELRESLVNERDFANHFTNQDYCEIALEYIKRMRSNKQIDFSGLLSETIRLLQSDSEVLSKLQSRFDFIQVDETQDTNYAQFKIIQLLGAHNNVLMVGDPDQCQPAGALIETASHGSVSIENLDEKIHKLVSFSSAELVLVGREHGFSFKKSAREYQGNMYTLQVADRITKCTANHKWTVKIDYESIRSKYATMLMRRGDCWLLGNALLYEFEEFSNDNVLKPITIAKALELDEFWILETFDTLQDADLHERHISKQYNIKNCYVTLHHDNNLDLCKSLFISSNDTGAICNYEKCLNSHRRQIDYPFWQRAETDCKYIKNEQIITIEACNLLPGVMLLPVPCSISACLWYNLELVNVQKYDGIVYSLDVDKHEHYITDGIVTHNSIYSWRGARYKNIEDFVKNNNAKVISLLKNYRSTPEIIKTASALIGKNSNRQQSIQFQTDNQNGKPVECICLPTPDLEADWIAYKVRQLIDSGEYAPHQIAILYRLNSMSRAIEQSLLKKQISYELIGGFSFYDRSEIKDCISMLRFLANNNDGLAFGRFVNKPSCKIGETTIGQIENLAKNNSLSILETIGKLQNFNFTAANKLQIYARMKTLYQAFNFNYVGCSIGDLLTKLIKDLSYDDYLEQKYENAELHERRDNIQEFINSTLMINIKNDGDLETFLNNIALQSSSDKQSEKDSVSLMSLHSSKGLEFPVVFMPCVEEGQLPHARAMAERDGLEEERRLCYVGMTRAEERLFITYPQTRVQRIGNGSVKYIKSMPSRFIAESNLADCIKIIKPM